MKHSILILSLFSMIIFSCDTSEKKNETPEKSNELSEEVKNEYIEKGISFAMQTQKQLGKNLMKQIKTSGTAKAVSFCNLKALKIVDSMKNVLNANISRVTDKPRNVLSEADSEDLKIIENFKNTLINGEKPKPLIKEIGEKVNFYSPILTNGMCLQCHGNEKDVIKFEVKSILDSLYPNDKARGYLPNQIRGVWKVVFEK